MNVDKERDNLIWLHPRLVRSSSKWKPYSKNSFDRLFKDWGFVELAISDVKKFVKVCRISVWIESLKQMICLMIQLNEHEQSAILCNKNASRRIANKFICLKLDIDGFGPRQNSPFYMNLNPLPPKLCFFTIWCILMIFL
jgi:hypothetical protein